MLKDTQLVRKSLFEEVFIENMNGSWLLIDSLNKQPCCEKVYFRHLDENWF